TLSLTSSKAVINPCLVPWTKVDLGYLAISAAKLSPIVNLRDGAANLALFRGSMLALGIMSLWVGDGSSNGRDGILGNGDDRGDNEDGGGNGGIGVVAYSAMRASMGNGMGV
ncbi:hypothetical protein Tco_0057132, partial [Tanacetum coccineum]